MTAFIFRLHAAVNDKYSIKIRMIVVQLTKCLGIDPANVSLERVLNDGESMVVDMSVWPTDPLKKSKRTK
jgi:hypothetical protein